MKQLPGIGPGVVLAVALGLGGCAAGTAENCDALNAGNVFQNAACLNGGGYEARLAQIEAQTRQEIQRAAVFDQDTAAQRATLTRLARDRSALDRQTRELTSGLASLRLQADGARARTQAQKAQLAAVQKELTTAENELARIRGGNAGSSEEVARLQESIKKKEEVIKTILVERIE
ncbi:hypothetical protein [Pararhodospirillum oryzae]|uniref:Lipoprotein n=1 Tax=Pararhodospirillum oryzae TaxID=478448 RepID=A0A512H8F5_9PROT|nr:hypothetical protein [Pararhodospirillum oryzae]GEO81727.1 hypothetical protein ROR02_18580 [Pararhodospirillum oryzae]